MIKTNELPNVTGFKSTDGFVVDASTGTGRLTGANAGEFMKSYLNLEELSPYRFHNAGTHSSHYRGKNLGSSFTAAQSTATRNGTFTDLYVGDYWSFSNVSYNYVDENDKVVSGAKISAYAFIGGCSPERYAGGDSLTTNYLLVYMMFPGITAPMNLTNTTEGGYVGCHMRNKYITGSKDGYYRRIEAIIRACFGADHILTANEYLVNAVTNGRPTGGAWTNSTVELLDERDICSSFVYDSGSSDGTNVYARDSIIKKPMLYLPAEMNNRNDYWLRNVVNGQRFSCRTMNGAVTTWTASQKFCIWVKFRVY